jgi:hypothetical protein
MIANITLDQLQAPRTPVKRYKGEKERGKDRRFVSIDPTFLSPPVRAKPPRTQAAARTLKTALPG